MERHITQEFTPGPKRPAAYFEMFNVFEAYIRIHATFTVQEMEAIRSIAVPITLPKRQQLLGDCSHYTFVCHGCLRTYRIDDDGTEHVLDFVAANRWATEHGSKCPQSPSPEYIEALEDTQVIQIPGEQFQRLIKEIPGLEVLYQRINMEGKIRLWERIYSMVSRPAVGRYRDFKQQYPELCHYIPLYMIASYLGLARETLSRIRANDRGD
jgi:CRP-like cAMP-binding protein